jgi:uncharacterized repeat protein (TIGR01451 family)
VGTIGGGLRIFDITNPMRPRAAGRNFTTGYQNDVQVRGNIAVLSYDGVAGGPVTSSTCLATRYPEANGQGVDVFQLHFNPENAANPGPLTPAFTTTTKTCFPNPPGGAHNSTLHPSGKYLAISNPSSDWAVDIFDLRNLPKGQFFNRNRHNYRLIDESRRDASRCPANASFQCIVIKRPPSPNLGSSRRDVPYNQFDTSGCPPKDEAAANSACGLWRPHDVFFSQDGDTMYVAALNSTFIVNTARLLRDGRVPTKTIIPNFACPDAGPAACGRSNETGLANTHNLELSHQADTTADGKILVISDERGGGVTNTDCNENDLGTIGGTHYWALAPVPGAARRTANASVAQPVKLGTYFNPDPSVASPDPIGRAERACTSHVFRIGGNGSASPGPIDARFDGVSRLASRLMTQAWYGAGVWYINFRSASIDNDGQKEDPRSTWGNTRGWNIQPGADTWSAKEYKGYIYAGDIARGFDVYGCATPDQSCDPVVTLTKFGPPSAERASKVQFEVSYSNHGPAASDNAKIRDRLPAELRFVSASTDGTYNPDTRTVSWKLGSVPVGESGTVKVTTLVRSTAPVGSAIVNKAFFTGELTISPPTAVTVTWVTP